MVRTQGWILLSSLKDKVSLMKATLTNKRTISRINKAVIRATTRTSSSPPPEYRIATVLNFGHETRPLACACVEAIMDRLHNTRSPYVALKCLFILHHIITWGSFILKDQLSFFPLSGGQNSLKLSKFRNKTNVETWELSLWVQWYAGILERNLMTSRVLGYYFTSSSSHSKTLENYKVGDGMSQSMEFDLLRELDSLVSMVEGICAAPESLHYQKMDLVHELMLLVSEDYRCTQIQITMRLKEFGDSARLDRLSSNDSSELISCLKRLEICWPRLIEMFANRKRNDAFWELISQVKIRLEIMNEKRERRRIVVWKERREGLTDESTRFGRRVVETSQALRLLPCGSQGLGVDRVQLSASTALVS